MHLTARPTSRTLPLLLPLVLLASLAPLASGAAAQSCGVAVGPDIVCTELSGPLNAVASATHDALAIGTVASNVGTAEALWFGTSTQHPVIGQALYRILREGSGATRFEQVGRSWVKHGQVAHDQPGPCATCVASDSFHLGVGCSDVYGATLNGMQSILGPRSEVDAFSGAIVFPPSNQVPFSGSTARRIEVALADLGASDFATRWYVGEAQYVAADDAAAGNAANNVTHRDVLAFQSGGEWSFGFSGPNRVGEPAIAAWRRIDPLVRAVDVQVPGEGTGVLAWKVTELPGGLWDYEYALYNRDSHDSFRSFALAVPAGTTVSAFGFHDLDYAHGDGPSNVDLDGTDWSATLVGGTLRWECAPFATQPDANALRWGSVMNFRFLADAGPSAGSLTLGTFRSDATFGVTAQVPGAPGTATGSSFCAGDGSATACPQGPGCALGAAGEGCANSTGQGAWLRGVGTPAADDVQLLASGLPQATTAVVIAGASSELNGQGIVFGDGLLCVAQPLTRGIVAVVEDGTLLVPLPSPGASGTRYYQVLYRNASPSFCTPARFNLSNGYAIAWP